MKYVRIWAALAALFVALPAAAQWQVPDHAVPIGRGGGITGFKNAAPGTTGLPFVSAGASADPLFQLLGFGGGGTNATTQIGARNNMFPAPTRAGDVAYWNGTIWVTLAGNNSGSNCFGENSSGTPAWVTCVPGGSSGQVQYNNAGAFGGFTVSGDAALNTSTGVLTLTTVNANVGSFGSATQCVAFTTNAKGLITAASAVTCTPAVTSLTGLGANVATALSINIGTAGSFVVNGGALGTPISGTLTNAVGLPISTGVAGLGTSVATALGVNIGTAGSFVVNGGALGTPSSGVGTNITGIPIGTGVAGLGTGVATALSVNVGTAGSFVVNGGALGTPSSGIGTNITGVPISTGVSGLGAGCATWLATPSSANLRGCMNDETGTGLAYFQGGDIGTPSAGVGTNITALNASNLSSGTALVARGGTGQNTLTANAFLTGNGTAAINQVAITGLVLGNGASAPTAYGGTSACTNQFMTALSALGVATCTSVTLASAQFANQGTTTTLLHGNAAGNPSFGAVSLTADVTGVLPTANGGVDQTAYPLTTPAVTATTGTFTTVSSTLRIRQFGKFVHYYGKIVVTSLGTATGRALLPLSIAQLSGSGTFPTATALVDPTFTSTTSAVGWDASNTLSVSLVGITSGQTVHFNGTYEAN